MTFGPLEQIHIYIYMALCLIRVAGRGFWEGSGRFDPQNRRFPKPTLKIESYAIYGLPLGVDPIIGVIRELIKYV